MRKFIYIIALIFCHFFVQGQVTNSTEVGVTEGQLSVSLTGAANYSIPISVPPGITGVEPKISLSYSSQGGYDLAGIGWSISGVSVITRIPSTQFHDGIIDPVDYDELDRFALDGQRLIVKNGTSGVYGADGTQYETESFSNLKITSSRSDGNGPPDSFTVEYPDGSFAIYGEIGTNSRTLNQYGIAYWQNPQGVRISYQYFSENNNLRLDSITYGSIGDNAPINKIKFVYVARNQPQQSYVGGVSNITDKIIHQILITSNGLGFKNYDLAYGQVAGYERLSSITEKTGDNSKTYNSTVFSYWDNLQGPPGILALNTKFVENINNSEYRPETITGDFDGNGDLDFAVGTKIYNNISDDPSVPVQSTIPLNLPYQPSWPPHRYSTIRCLEPNNQGGYKMMDRDAMTADSYNYQTNTMKFFVCTQDLVSNVARLEYTKQCVLPNVNAFAYDRPYCLEGDFNGDGLTDKLLYAREPNNNQMELYFVNLDRRISSDYVKHLGSINVSYDDYKEEKYLHAGDFNGDGKTDLILIRGGSINSISVYSLDNDNNLIIIWETPFNFIHYNQNDSGTHYDLILAEGLYRYPVLIADFNGDGKSDILFPGSDRKLLLSTGVSFIAENLPGNFPSKNNLGSLMAADFNNDGKVDILSLTSNNNRNLQPTSEVILTITYNKRTAYGIWTSETRSYPGRNSKYFNWGINPIMIKPSKVYGGLPELLLYEAEAVLALDGSQSYLQRTKIGFFVKLDALSFNTKAIRSIVLGNGVTETVSYAQLKDGNGIYTKASNDYLTYPFYDLGSSGNINVVSKIEKSFSGFYKKQLYSYFASCGYIGGLGYLGFKSIAKTNWFVDDSQAITNISKFDVYSRSALKETFSVLGLVSPDVSLLPADEFVEKTIYRYNGDDGTSGSGRTLPFLMPNKVFKLFNTYLGKFNGLEGTSSEVSKSYDDYMNPLTVTTVVKNGSTSESISLDTFTYDPPLSAPYMVGRPLQKTNVTTANNDTTGSEESYIFDKNLLKEVKKKGHNTVFLTENNDYDDYGNLIRKTFTAPGLNPRVLSYEFGEQSHRFLTKKTDIEGLETNYTYDQNTGALLSELLPSNPSNQLLTKYKYDKWGKLIEKEDYLGKKTTYIHGNGSDGSSITSLYPDSPDNSQIIMDKLGRVTQKRELILDTYSYTDMQYDINDKIIYKSQPYSLYPTSQMVWNEMEYDVYGRLIKSISLKSNSSPGKQITYSYSGLTRTENESLKTKQTTTNAIGDVVFVSETPGETISYEYFANRNLKSVNCSGGVTTFQQDGWGRRTRLIDPSAGERIHEYNHFGEITKEIIVGSGEIQYSINDVGKTENKIILDANGNMKTKSTYGYNSSKLLDNIIFQDYAAGTQTSYHYGYDEYRRLNFKDENGLHAYFQQTTDFDEFGRPSVELYTMINPSDMKRSDKKIKNVYKNGSKWKVLDNDSQAALWQTNSVNQNGQVLSARIGYGMGTITVTNNYDEFGFPTEINHDKGSFNVMNLTNNFDPIRRNLMNRSNNMFGTSWDEQFYYDNTDRLQIYSDVLGIQTQTYNQNGTIKTNNIGTYRYGIQGKPYQVSKIDLPNPSPSATYYTGREQNITYNAFKKPVTITEEGSENIDFQYNAFDGRASMFYGSLDSDKNQRPYRKFYSADGFMEIKRKMTSPSSVEFTTFIGGDAYTAPVIFRSDGTTKNFFNLHRDYQGSIIAITDKSGNIVEKRLFDVWGSLIKYENNMGITVVPTTSTELFLDRGYTGHEHLLGVGLINMNGRIYDPKLHRFLQPDNDIQDPLNYQNFNRYGYVMNNPTKYSDKNGENWGLVLGFIFSTYVHGAQATGEANPFKWNISDYANATLQSTSSIVSYAATTATNQFLDTYNNPSVAQPENSSISNNANNHSYVKEGWWSSFTNTLGSLWNSASNSEEVINEKNNDCIDDLVKWWDSTDLYFEVGGDVSIGVQAGLGFEVNKTKVKVDANLASVKLVQGSARQGQSDFSPWSLTGSYVGKNGIYSINQNVAVPFFGYEHSFNTMGYGYIGGTEVHQYNVGPFTGTNQGAGSIRLGFGAAFVIGVNGYVEFGVRPR